ncbi:MAG TPA: ATP-binding protein [bacterium]|nr:ATP-binding protein [bacterium]
MYKRRILEVLLKRFKEPKKFIQVLIGPRQTGKTTLSVQVSDAVKMVVHSSSADDAGFNTGSWIEQQWETARIKAKKNKRTLLIIDEIQKINKWSETVKKLWDADAKAGNNLYVLLLGSSSMLLNKGLGESLAGRFETINVRQWAYEEMKKAFGYSVEKYIYYGGYPGGASLIKDHARWAGYIRNSLIESTVSKDILQMTRVDKPALLRRLFELGCRYSGQVLSYNKILGQLQDAGNTITLAHYLDLLSGAGMLCGLNKFSGQKARQRASSPKFLALDSSLISAQLSHDFREAAGKKELWGRLVESCVGAHLVNSSQGSGVDVMYWANDRAELDFVLSKAGRVAAIEVKSGRKKEKAPGIDCFAREFKTDKKYLVGTGGIPLEEFLALPAAELI